MSSDAASINVGGNMTINSSPSGPTSAGLFYNYGMSTLSVVGAFTINGDGGSVVYDGLSSSDNPTITVGGSFSLGANSSVYTYGSSPFSVAGSFTLGANSFFNDFGMMSVAGAFDPGSGNAANNNTVGGTFIAAAGSSVTTNTATWEVLAGGQLNVHAGATVTVANGGNLLVDSGAGTVTIDGTLDVFGSVNAALGSGVVVEGIGSMITESGAQVNINGTLLQWANPANITAGTALGAAQLNATANVPGTFTYTLSDGVTPASGAVLGAGQNQVLIVTFTPSNPTFSSVSARVRINVV
jgi:hypothetical protein